MSDEILYMMALTCALPYQSQVQRQLLEEAGSAKALYEHRHELRNMMPEVNERLAAIVAGLDSHMGRAEEEVAFAEKNHIRIVGLHDADFPARLNECLDAPILLYYRGSADMNCRHTLSIVGTRKATQYGCDFCQHLLADLKRMCPDTLVVSGLAYGIDIQAHRRALENGMPTIGVLAHGLDQIYPPMHRQTAIEMLEQGGLLTEYMSRSIPEKLNFVSRNRIVAGMTDATLVVESAQKGGSLITARIANEYGRDVFAVPGRIGDGASAGCNLLIRDNRAALVQSAEELVKAMGWATVQKEKQPVQGELFPELSADETAVFRALKGCDGKHLNQLAVDTDIPIGRLTSLLFDMEMRGLIRSMSGGTYRLLTF